MKFLVPVLIVAFSMGVGAGAVVFVSERLSRSLSFVASALIGAAVGGICGLAYPARAFEGGAIYTYVGAGVLSFLFLNGVVKWANNAG